MDKTETPHESRRQMGGERGREGGRARMKERETVKENISLVNPR